MKLKIMYKAKPESKQRKKFPVNFLMVETKENLSK